MNFNLKSQLKDPATEVHAAWVGWFEGVVGKDHIGGIYLSSDPSIIKSQCQEAKALGISGFVPDMYPGLPTISAIALRKECDAQGLKISCMLEGRYGRAELDKQVQSVRDNFVTGNSLYTRLHGKPVLWEFGFRENGVDLAAFAKAHSDFVILAQTNPIATVTDTYSWVNLSPGYADRINPKATVPAAWFQFDDRLAKWGTGRLILPNDGKVWQNCIDTINSRPAGTTPLCLIVTWNDYEEGTAIEMAAKAQSAGITPVVKPPVVIPSVVSYPVNISIATKSILTAQVSDGAILKTPAFIEPYSMNLAALGLVAAGQVAAAIKAAQWYIAKMNLAGPDKWGGYGTVYDYNGSVGAEKSTDMADSTDSYAATFISLMRAIHKFGNAAARLFICDSRRFIDIAVSVILSTMQQDGLTFALPDYPVAYLMDNCEVYGGLVDAAALYRYAYNDEETAKRYDTLAVTTRAAILSMWNGTSYLTAKGEKPVNLSVWYPDTTSQFWPILFGLTSKAQTALIVSLFKSKWPNWARDITGDPAGFPWVEVACGMAMAGEYSLVNSWLASVKAKFIDVSPQLPYPWYCAQSGWFIRLNRMMMFKDGLQ